MPLTGFDPGAGGGSDEELLARWDAETSNQDQGGGGEDIPAADVGSYKAYQGMYGPQEYSPGEAEAQQYQEAQAAAPDEHPQVGFDAGDTTDYGPQYTDEWAGNDPGQAAVADTGYQPEPKVGFMSGLGQDYAPAETYWQSPDIGFTRGWTDGFQEGGVSPTSYYNPAESGQVDDQGNYHEYGPEDYRQQSYFVDNYTPDSPGGAGWTSGLDQESAVGQRYVGQAYWDPQFYDPQNQAAIQDRDRTAQARFDQWQRTYQMAVQAYQAAPTPELYDRIQQLAAEGGAFQQEAVNRAYSAGIAGNRAGSAAYFTQASQIDDLYSRNQDWAQNATDYAYEQAQERQVDPEAAASAYGGQYRYQQTNRLDQLATAYNRSALSPTFQRDNGLTDAEMDIVTAYARAQHGGNQGIADQQRMLWLEERAGQGPQGGYHPMGVIMDPVNAAFGVAGDVLGGLDPLVNQIPGIGRVNQALGQGATAVLNAVFQIPESEQSPELQGIFDAFFAGVPEAIHELTLYAIGAAQRGILPTPGSAIQWGVTRQGPQFGSPAAVRATGVQFAQEHPDAFWALEQAANLVAVAKGPRVLREPFGVARDLPGQVRGALDNVRSGRVEPPVTDRPTWTGGFNDQAPASASAVAARPDRFSGDFSGGEGLPYTAGSSRGGFDYSAPARPDFVAGVPEDVPLVQGRPEVRNVRPENQSAPGPLVSEPAVGSARPDNAPTQPRYLGAERFTDNLDQFSQVRRDLTDQVRQERAAIPEAARWSGETYTNADITATRSGPTGGASKRAPWDRNVNPAWRSGDLGLPQQGLAASDAARAQEVRRARAAIRAGRDLPQMTLDDARRVLSDTDYQGTEHGPGDYERNPEHIGWQETPAPEGVYRDPERLSGLRINEEDPAKFHPEYETNEERQQRLLGTDGWRVPRGEAGDAMVQDALVQAQRHLAEVERRYGGPAERFKGDVEALGVWQGGSPESGGHFVTGRLGEYDRQIRALDDRASVIRHRLAGGDRVPPKERAALRRELAQIDKDRWQLINDKTGMRYDPKTRSRVAKTDSQGNLITSDIEKRKAAVYNAKYYQEVLDSAQRDVEVLQDLVDQRSASPLEPDVPGALPGDEPFAGKYGEFLPEEFQRTMATPRPANERPYVKTGRDTPTEYVDRNSAHPLARAATIAEQRHVSRPFRESPQARIRPPELSSKSSPEQVRAYQGGPSAAEQRAVAHEAAQARQVQHYQEVNPTATREARPGELKSPATVKRQSKEAAKLIEQRVVDLKEARDVEAAFKRAQPNREARLKPEGGAANWSPVAVSAKLQDIAKAQGRKLKEQAQSGQLALAAAPTYAYAQSEDDENQDNTGLKVAAIILGTLGLGYALGKHPKVGGRIIPKLVKSTERDLPGATGWDKLARTRTTQRLKISRASGAYVYTHAVPQFEMAARNKLSLQGVVSRMNDVLDGKGKFQPKTPEQGLLDQQFQNLMQVPGVKAQLKRDLPQLVSGALGDPAQFSRLFTARLNELLADPKLIGTTWEAPPAQLVSAVKRPAADALLFNNPGFLVEQVVDGSIHTALQGTIEQLGFRRTAGAMQAMRTALSDPLSGWRYPDYIATEFKQGVGGEAKPTVLGNNPVAKGIRHATGKNEVFHKETQFVQQGSAYLNTAFAESLGEHRSILDWADMLPNSPFFGRVKDLPDLSFAQSVKRGKTTLAEDLIGLQDRREVRQVVLDYQKQGLITKDQARNIQQVFDSHQADAAVYAENEVRSHMRDYDYQTNLDGVLGNMTMFSYWTVHNIAFTAKMAAKHPLASGLVALAAMKVMQENSDLPNSAKMSIRMPVRTLIEYGLHGEGKKIALKALDLAFGEDQDPRLNLWNFVNPFIPDLAKSIDRNDWAALKTAASQGNISQLFKFAGDYGIHMAPQFDLAGRFIQAGADLPHWLDMLTREPVQGKGFFGSLGNTLRYIGEMTPLAGAIHTYNRRLTGQDYTYIDQKGLEAARAAGESDNDFFRRQAVQSGLYWLGAKPAATYRPTASAPQQATATKPKRSKAQEFFGEYGEPSDQKPGYWTAYNTQVRGDTPMESNANDPARRGTVRPLKTKTTGQRQHEFFDRFGDAPTAAGPDKNAYWAAYNSAVSGLPQDDPYGARPVVRANATGAGARAVGGVTNDYINETLKYIAETAAPMASPEKNDFYNTPMSDGGPTPSEFIAKYAKSAQNPEHLPQSTAPVAAPVDPNSKNSAGRTPAQQGEYNAWVKANPYPADGSPDEKRAWVAAAEQHGYTPKYSGTSSSTRTATPATRNNNYIAKPAASKPASKPASAYQTWAASHPYPKNGTSAEKQAWMTEAGKRGWEPPYSGTTSTPRSGGVAPKASTARPPTTSKPTWLSGFQQVTKGTAKADQPLEPGISARDVATQFNATYADIESGKRTIKDVLRLMAEHQISGGNVAPYLKRLKYEVYQEIRAYRGATRQAGDKQRGEWFGAVKALPDTMSGLVKLARIQDEVRQAGRAKVA